MARRRPVWMIAGCTALWIVLLALLPWWLGLPALLAPGVVGRGFAVDADVPQRTRVVRLIDGMWRWRQR